ncbi:hypothetical protein EV1_012341 [Malus domestica]
MVLDGISCNTARSVTAINLTISSIQGTMHGISFLSFPTLEYLNLSYNNLFDVIPPQISSLSKLIHLDLSNNQSLQKSIIELGLDQNQLNDHTLQLLFVNTFTFLAALYILAAIFTIIVFVVKRKKKHHNKGEKACIKKYRFQF